MGKDKKPSKSTPDDAGTGDLLDKFKKNITISRDDEGVIVKFKQMAPGVSIEMLKSLIENMMGPGNKDLMKRFKDMMGAGGDEDDESEDSDSSGDDEDEGPGFRVDLLGDNTGFKLIPDDPAEIDQLLDTIKSIFDPETFKTMMDAAFQMFGLKPGSLPGDAGDDKEDDPEKRRKGSDTNMTRDYFYT